MGKIKQMPKTKGNNQINKKNIQMTKLKKKKKKSSPHHYQICRARKIKEKEHGGKS